MVGPDRFIGPVQTLLPCVQFCTSAPAQDALCKALVKAAEPYEDASRLHMKHTYAHTSLIIASSVTMSGCDVNFFERKRFCLRDFSLPVRLCSNIIKMMYIYFI